MWEESSSSSCINISTSCWSQPVIEILKNKPRCTPEAFPKPQAEILMLPSWNLKFSRGGYWFYPTERTSRGSLESISLM
jgi:hypothetical protein